MFLKSLNLENFRCYKSLNLEFKERVTVLVATNGQGKTTILDSIRIALLPYMQNFDLAHTGYYDSATSISIDDIRIIKKNTFEQIEMARQLPSRITACCEFEDNHFTWTRLRNSEAQGSRTKDDPSTKKLKSYAKNIQDRIRDFEQKPLNLPVFGYYGTGRLWKEKRLMGSKKDNKSIINSKIRTLAYRDCLDPASSFKQFEDWFVTEYKQNLERKIIALEEGAPISDIQNHTIDVVSNAVNTILEIVGWKSLTYNQKYQALVLKHDKYGLMKMSQLSDGIKNMIAMIADIAYRCVLLNGHLGKAAALRSKGLIMIDEIDMHLHPEWQQVVISSLEKAFENIQFIVTTHSPQVLTTVKSSSICILDEGTVYEAPKGSQGAESSRLLRSIFKVANRPKNIEITKKLESYAEKVYGDKWEEVSHIRTELYKEFGNEEPLLTSLDLYIENRKWELSFEKD